MSNIELAKRYAEMLERTLSFQWSHPVVADWWGNGFDCKLFINDAEGESGPYLLVVCSRRLGDDGYVTDVQIHAQNVARATDDDVVMLAGTMAHVADYVSSIRKLADDWSAEHPTF